MPYRLLPFLTATAALAAVLIACVNSQSVQADHHAAGEHAEEAEGEAIAVGIITGQNNHQWSHDAPALKAILDADGRFETELMVSPSENDPDKAAKWEAFRPDFSNYDVVIVNYNSGGKRDDWPGHVKAAFEGYIKEGGKAYIFHAGNNAFVGWQEYEQMVGLLWRKADYGNRVFLDDEGQRVTLPAGEDIGAGHGPRHAYAVQTREPEHPIFNGLPELWMHAEDELYHGQRGPAENMTILASAYSKPNPRGTGKHEPVVWTIPYGQGLVLTNVMGHWMGDQAPAVQCAGFQTVFIRSIEFLATGQVTSAVPDDFPTADAVSMRELIFEPIADSGQPLHDAYADCCEDAGHDHFAGTGK